MLQTKTVSGLRLAFTDSGEPDRPVIILMHGWGCTHETLASVGRVAHQAGYRVVSVDFPGFGQSEEPHEVWGVEEYTRQIEELIDSLGIGAPVLLGHSFGGRVGILYSSRHKVGRLSLVDAAGIKPRSSFGD